MKTQKSRFKTLFLCTGNSARSILAEYLLRKAGKDRFEVYSAGVNPKTAPHPMALAILQDNFQIDASNARSKSMEEFKDVEFDFVITVCDNAREACPVWPGRPIIAHWSSPGPSKTEGDEGAIKEAFWKVAQQINRRVELLVALPFEKLDALRLDSETKAIGQ
jgi:arsenate reductase (thioredoxin)